LHQIAHVGVSPRINLKLIRREIIFEVFTVPERHRRTHWRTDRRTDRHHNCGITALCVASRRKNPIEQARSARIFLWQYCVVSFNH